MRKCIFCLWLCFMYADMSSAQDVDVLPTVGGGVSLSWHRATGKPNFVRFSKDAALRLSGQTLEAQSRGFMQRFGSIFDHNHPDVELKLEKKVHDAQGFVHLTFLQHYHGIPIYDGRLKFHFAPDQNLQSINGNYLSPIKVNPVANLSAKQCIQLAIDHVHSQFPLASSLHGHDTKLYVFRKGLAQGSAGAFFLTYRVEVTDEQSVREYIFVDAHDGHIVEQFTGTHQVLFRRLYEVNTSNEIWTEGDPFPGSLDQWQQNELEAAGHTYYFFFHALGLDSYDGAGAEMKTINNDPNVNCPNAQWSGGFARYCTGTASDDVVAHEWGHAYTDFSSNLIYQWQAGAINESFSDIWGETIDLINNYEDAGEDLSLRTGCGSSDRWMLGEDASGFGGAIRDMWDPTCRNDPGKVSDPQYICSSIDNGGVHSNSGVPNHAYALLVDGGTYNGQTISGIGLTKAAHIFARANFHYLTETSDFAVLADALEMAATDLMQMAVDLEGLSTTATPAGPSGEIISAADISELQKVLLAVEMRTAPDCNFDPLLTGDTILCEMSLPDSAIFYEDFESGFGDWSFESIPENPLTWEPRDWVIKNDLPDNRAGSAAFGVDPVNGDCFSDLENGILRLESPIIAIPAHISSTIEMAFDHYVAMENLWDGGNIKYRLNGGSWMILPGSSFIVNGYNNTLNGGANDNPLATEPAFTGTDQGSVSGSWAISLINLSSIGVVAGSTIQFRFELGTDGCNGRVGWYLDDLRIFNCKACEDLVDLAEQRTMQEILFEAGSSIHTTDTLMNASHIIYSAGSNVHLQGGFEVQQGTVLEARIDGCELPADPPMRSGHSSQSLPVLLQDQPNSKIDESKRKTP